jgi:hypothetical protein
MSLRDCPCCWEAPGICQCTQTELDTFHKGIEAKRRKMEEFNKAHHKNPLWEAWKNYKKSQKK